MPGKMPRRVRPSPVNEMRKTLSEVKDLAESARILARNKAEVMREMDRRRMDREDREFLKENAASSCMLLLLGVSSILFFGFVFFSLLLGG